MITFKHRGSFRNTERFLSASKKKDYSAILNNYGRAGVTALAAATPKDTGTAASSWGYEVRKVATGYTVTWTNSNTEGGAPVVILVQYGHATRNGSFVEGRDFINPAMRPIFDTIAQNLWKEVTSP